MNSPFHLSTVRRRWPGSTRAELTLATRWNQRREDAELFATETVIVLGVVSFVAYAGQRTAGGRSGPALGLLSNHADIITRMFSLPEIVTHTFHPLRGPFHNLCTLAADEAERYLGEMRAVGRCLNPHYLARRLETEAWLRRARDTKLGATPLEHPIYFFVGDFADGRDPARPCAIRLPLAELPQNAITLTYGDSMSSREAFTLAEIRAIVASHGLPTREQSFIELQLWSREPLAKYI